LHSDFYLFSVIFMTNSLVYVDLDVYVKVMILTLNYLRLFFLINRLVPTNT